MTTAVFGLLKKTLRFVLFSSVFVATCAVVMCISTQKQLLQPLSPLRFYLFVWSAALMQYNGHYLIKKKKPVIAERYTWSQQHPQLHPLLLFIGAAGVVFCLPSIHTAQIKVLCLLFIAALLYSIPWLPFAKKRLKEFGGVKILLLSVVWTLVTVWLPMVGHEGNRPFFWMMLLQRFLFMMALCLAFDIRDLCGDKEEGIGTIPVKWGLETSYLLIDFLLVGFSITAVIQYLYMGQFYHLAALLLSAGITRYLVQLTKKYSNDYIYLAGIDGMMLLQSLLVIVFSVPVS